MTIIKYKDEDGWMTFQDMTGIKISIRNMRLEEEGLDEFKEVLNMFNQFFSLQVMPDKELNFPSIKDLLGINSKYELGQI